MFKNKNKFHISIFLLHILNGLFLQLQKCEEKMKLIFKQSQASKGMLSKSIEFSLNARVELTETEKANIDKYKMGQEVIYSDERAQLGAAQINHGGSLKSGVFNALTGLTITVNDMVRGKQIACKEILEMLHVKQTVEESCGQMKAMLDAAANFDGEDIVEL